TIHPVSAPRGDGKNGFEIIGDFTIGDRIDAIRPRSSGARHNTGRDLGPALCHYSSRTAAINLRL
ncbi:MAG: hypothetical protein ABW071_01285, partial [Casimicrobiaceae bacterium]